MDTPSRPSLIRRHPKTTLVVLVLLATAALDLTFTGVYHLVKYGTIHKYADRRAMGQRSPVFHHTLKPATHYSYQRWGHVKHSISTNSLGFTDKTVRRVPLTAGQDRILFMGDSFTQGVGYEYEQTFVGLLDAALARQHVEVLNAAVVSYSPAIYFKKTEYLLRDVGLDFDHLVVFLDISDIQDEAESYDLRDDRVVWIGGSTAAIRDFLYEYTTIPRNIWHLVAKVHGKVTDAPNARRTDEQKALGVQDHRSLWTIDESVYRQYGERGLAKAMRHMSLLYDLVQRHGIDMTLVVYPWPDQIMHQDLDSLHVRVWREWAAERGVSFLNLFPDFIRAGKDPEELIRAYFIPGDVHWNETGHRLVASRLLEEWKAIAARHPRAPRHAPQPAP